MERKKINGKYVNDMGCCGIFAAAIVMGLEPEDVFNDYKRRFKDPLTGVSGSSAPFKTL